MIISHSVEEKLKERPDDERKVVFLDIDGVLQPTTAQDRFKHDMEALKKELAEKYNDCHFLELDKYDVAAIYYDWDKKAVDFLHKLLSECDAEIVISSDWRTTKNIEDMKSLMKIHGLDVYITEMLPQTHDFSWKYEDIPVYLSEHPNLKSYIVIDDMNMEKYFRGRFVYCEKCFGKKEYYQAYRLLEYGLWWEESYDDKYIGRNLGTTINDEFEKVIFLDIDGVLNDDGERRRQGEIILEEYVRNLREIVNKTEAEIILSSSWRYSIGENARKGFGNLNSGLADLYRLFDKYQLCIAGATPIIYNGANGRPLEIRTWLTKRPSVKNFVILDDEAFWNWGWMKPFVVTTSYYAKSNEERVCGLDKQFAYRAIQILNNSEER